jgi:signal transduction histidine kinase
MMPRARQQRKPTFWWQGLLILLPVAVLAVLGALSLRQDRVLAEHDATERARGIAEDLLPKIWDVIQATNAPRQIAFEIDPSGGLLDPPPCLETPVPQAFDAGRLSAVQARLWNSATKSDSANSALTNYTALLASNPPRPFAAAATYRLAVLLAAAGEVQRSADLLGRVISDYPQAMGESGLPLAPLAELKLLELRENSPGTFTNAAPAPYDTFGSNVVSQPTALTPLLLDKAASLASAERDRADCQRWRKVWDEQETARQLYELARAGFPDLWNAPLLFGLVPHESVLTNSLSALPGAARVSLAAYDWHVVRAGASSTNGWFRARTEPDLGAGIRGVMESTRGIPAYFGVRVRLAGEPLVWLELQLRLWREQGYFGRRGGGVKKEILEDPATQVLASAGKRIDGFEALNIQVLLTSPEVLYKNQRARSFWFGSLILFSAVAAALGLFSAWRAFLRQQQLSDLKSNFVSSVSHELRAPIASVRLMAESLDGGKISDASKQREYFRFQECRRLSALIENVLDFSRIERGRKLYEFEPSDLVALVQTTVRLMEPAAAERGLHLALRLPPPETPSTQIAVDGKAIQQALVNLIDNAIKHSPKGETVTIGLEVANGVPPSDGTALAALSEPQASRFTFHVSLWVEDHGEGIPLEEHEKIFERFYRLGSELRRETQGVGIGLSIVKHIVEAHRGRVRVRSAVGQGSRFTIELPWNASS